MQFAVFFCCLYLFLSWSYFISFFGVLCIFLPDRSVMEESSFACFYCKQCASRFQIADKGVDDLGFQRVYCSNEGCPVHNHDFYVCQTCFHHGEQVNSIHSNARHKHRKASIHQTAAQELLSIEQRMNFLPCHNSQCFVL